MQLHLKDIDNLPKLSQFLRVQHADLDVFLENGTISFCKHFDLPKRNKRLGFRRVYKVTSETLKNIHKVFHGYLNSRYSPSDAVHGYVEKRNIKTNAAAHIGKKYILTVDIECFFESISFDTVQATLIELGAPQDIALQLARLITLDSRLVQGFVTSPIMANLCVQKLDEDIERSAKENGFCYTRYADDITISSDQEVSLETIETLVLKHGYKLNPNKTSLSRRGRKQFVTGLTVFDVKQPRIPKHFKKKLRLELYYLNPSYG